VRGVGVVGQSKVKGTVYGDEAELAGTVEARSARRSFSPARRMTGDIWHQDIKV
jgi:hypothetical protein